MTKYDGRDANDHGMIEGIMDIEELCMCGNQIDERQAKDLSAHNPRCEVYIVDINIDFCC